MVLHVKGVLCEMCFRNTNRMAAELLRAVDLAVRMSPWYDITNQTHINQSFIAQQCSTDKQLIQEILSEPDSKAREH